MSVNAMRLSRSGKYRSPVMPGPTVLTPTRAVEIRNALNPESRFSAPFRPMGANSSATECTSSSVGTVVDTSLLNQIKHVDPDRRTTTVQPGVRIGDLVNELAEYGLELSGGHDLMSRTVGGAVAGGCIGPSFGDDGAFLASQVDSIKLVTPDGKPIEIRSDQQNLMHAFRLSFGMLGIIYEIKLKVRPIRTFAVTHRRCSFDQFGAVAEKVANADVGLKFYLLPFRDRVYLDIRRHSPSASGTHRIPWKVKDWGESTVLPNVFKSINRIVPMTGVRYRLIDEISQMTQGIVNNRLVNTGSNSTALMSSAKSDDAAKKLNYCTWFLQGDY